MFRHGSHVSLLFFLAINFVYAERIKDMIYTSIDGVSPCFRRHNGTHQFGCSSNRPGNDGVIHLAESEADLRWLEQNATAGPYMIVMPFSMFKRETLSRLQATDYVSGVLLARNASEPLPEDYSPEDTCPNRYSSLGGQCSEEKPWNPFGNRFLREDWPFPIFYMQNDTLLGELKDCYRKHNAHNRTSQAQRPLCALEMKSFMFAAFCDPLGDWNVHWPLGPLTERTKSVVLVIARLDADSMFNGLTPGGNSAIAAIVTLLATAFRLSTLNVTVEDKNVLFSLLNGESFDYIGSGRMVYDLRKGKFNAIGGKSLKIDQISEIIELGQLGAPHDRLFAHASNHEKNPLLESLIKDLELENSTLKDSIPPTSAQSFRAINSKIPTAVIANHGQQFTNRYYHSLLDASSTLGFDSEGKEKLVDSLSTLATKLSNVLYGHVTNGKSAPKAAEDAKIRSLVDEMLGCYLSNPNCTLFRAAHAPGADMLDQVWSLYIGVTRAPSYSTSTTGQLLVLLTGEKLPNLTSSECIEKRLSWMAGYNFTGVCVNSTVNYTVAVSPAFIIDDYDMKSGEFSTWTESVWSLLSVRMYLKPSAATERLSIVLGSAVAVFSFVVVWFINSRADLLFDDRRIADC